jgi:hypothetical protein
MNVLPAMLYGPLSSGLAISSAVENAAMNYSRTGKVLGQCYDTRAPEIGRDGGLEDAMKSAFYSKAQFANQRGVYQAVLDRFQPQKGEVLADWGSNIGGLAYTAQELGQDAFHYVGIDASEQAVAFMNQNLGSVFSGPVTGIHGSQILHLKPGSIDYIAALGSLTHWLTDIKNPESQFIELVVHLATIANRGVAVSIYPDAGVRRGSVMLGSLAFAMSMWTLYSASAHGYSSESLLGIATLLAGVQITICQQDVRRMLSRMILGNPSPEIQKPFSEMLNKARVISSQVMMNGPRIVQELNKRGLQAEHIRTKNDATDGPNDLIFVKAT